MYFCRRQIEFGLNNDNCLITFNDPVEVLSISKLWKKEEVLITIVVNPLPHMAILGLFRFSSK